MKISAEQRRALGILAGARRGATEAVMLANGFQTELAGGAGAGGPCDGGNRDGSGWRAAREGRAILYHGRRSAGIARMTDLEAQIVNELYSSWSG